MEKEEKYDIIGRVIYRYPDGRGVYKHREVRTIIRHYGIGLDEAIRKMGEKAEQIKKNSDWESEVYKRQPNSGVVRIVCREKKKFLREYAYEILPHGAMREFDLYEFIEERIHQIVSEELDLDNFEETGELTQEVLLVPGARYLLTVRKEDDKSVANLFRTPGVSFDRLYDYFIRTIKEAFKAELGCDEVIIK